MNRNFKYLTFVYECDGIVNQWDGRTTPSGPDERNIWYIVICTLLVIKHQNVKKGE